MNHSPSIVTAAFVIVVSFIFVVIAKGWGRLRLWMAFAICATCLSAAPQPLRELSLCYDDVRWPEAARVARRGGCVVLNVNDGRGSDADEARRWDAFGVRLRTVGGITLGYVDFLTRGGQRKSNATVVAEALAWIDAKHTGVFLDDARDRKLDADAIAEIRTKRPKALLWANPGTRCKGPLKATKIPLCESEKTGAINYGSTVIIAFVKDTKEASNVRSMASQRGVAYLALEPFKTYHKAGSEYQLENPLVP